MGAKSAGGLEEIIASNNFDGIAAALTNAGCTRIAHHVGYNPLANTMMPFELYQLPPDGRPDGSSLFFAMRKDMLNPKKLAEALFWRAGTGHGETPESNALVALTSYGVFQSSIPPKPATQQATANVLETVAKGIGILNFLALTVAPGCLLYSDAPEEQKPLALAVGAAIAVVMLSGPALILYLRTRHAMANNYYPGKAIKEGFRNRLEGRGALEAAFSLSGMSSSS